MNRHVRWFVTLFVVGGIVAASLVPAFAAEPGGDLRRLVLENRVAQVIADLRLTDDQKEQLKELASDYRSAVSATREELAELLAKRRDALLSGDREALNEVNEALRALARRNSLELSESAQEFISGLTERQKQLLSQIFPGLGQRIERRVERGFDRRLERRLPEHRVRVLPRMPEVRWRAPRFERLPAPEVQRRIVVARPEWAVPVAAPGHGLEVVDVLIELLER